MLCFRWPTAVVIAALLGGAAGCGGDDVAAGPVHVDASAAPGGDGSAAAPFDALRPALEAGAREIVIAPGSYPAPPAWTFAAPTTLRGAEGTVIVAEAAGERLDWSSAAGLTIDTIAFGAGLTLTGSVLNADAIAFTGVVGPALALDGGEAAIDGLVIASIEMVAGAAGTGDGVVADGVDLTLEGASITEAPDRAVVLRGGTATLRGLTLSSVARSPLAISDGASASASALSIAGAGVGIFVDAATFDLEDSTLDGTASAGVLGGSGATIRVVRSTFTACRSGCINALNAAVDIDDCLFDGTVDAPCVSASQGDGAFALRNSTLQNCAGNGVAVTELADATIEGNLIQGITPDPLFPAIADGVQVLDGSATIRGNTIRDAAGFGVALIRAAGTIDDNDIGPVEGAGVSVTDAAPTRAVISDNRIDEAKGAGVLVLAAQADVTGNQVTGTRYEGSTGLGDGIAFGEGGDVVASGNSCDDSARNGMAIFAGATGSIDGNTLTNNLLYGIRDYCLDGPTTVTIGTNTYSGNGGGETDLVCP